MQGQGVVGLREPLEEAVVEHHAGPGPDLLGRLTDEHQRPAPAVLQAGQRAGRADPAGHVHVVAAGVHDADLVAGLVAGADGAGVGPAGLFRHRQGVQVGADQDGRAGAVFEDGDDAVAADVGRHLKPDLAQFVGQTAGCLAFLGRKLRVGVNVL